MKISGSKRQLILMSCLSGSLLTSLAIFSFKKPATSTNNLVDEVELQTATLSSSFKVPTTLEELRNSNPEDIAKLEKYDGRKYGLTTSIKDQGSEGLCWAYALAAASEASILKEGFLGNTYNNSTFDLNPHSIDWASNVRTRAADKLGLAPADTFSRVLGKGFSLREASLALLQWGAPNLMDRDYKSYNNQVAKLENVVQLVGERDRGVANVDSIKKSVAKYGAVAFGYTFAGNDHSKYLNNSVMDQNRGKVSHACTIVGWDDTIPRYMFDNTATRNGGWIVKNSWGKHRFDKGYFYMSYDSNLTRVVAVDYAPNDEYQHNYYYDGLNLGIDSMSVTGQRKYNELAAVFPALKGTPTEKECLKGVNVSFNGEKVKVEAKVYKNVPVGNESLDKVSPVQGEQVWSKTEEFDHAGSYTLKVEEEIELERGSYFSVVVKVTNATGDAEVLVSPEFTYTNDLTYYKDSDETWKNCWDVNKSVAKIKAFTTTKATGSTTSSSDLKYADVRFVDDFYRHGDPVTSINPIVTINGKMLKKDEDYAVEYASYNTRTTNAYSDDASAGQVKLTIIGKNKYTGTTSKYIDMKVGLRPKLDSIGWYGENDVIIINVNGKSVSKYSDIDLPDGWKFTNASNSVYKPYNNYLEYDGSDKLSYRKTHFSVVLSTDSSQRKDISQAVIATDGLYSRTSTKQIVTVKMPEITQALQENVDYRIKYVEDKYEDKIVTALIEGIGNYFGEKKVIVLTDSFGTQKSDYYYQPTYKQTVEKVVSEKPQQVTTKQKEVVQKNTITNTTKVVTPKPTPAPAPTSVVRPIVKPKPQPMSSLKQEETTQPIVEPKLVEEVKQEVDKSVTIQQPVETEQVKTQDNTEVKTRQKRDASSNTRDISSATVSITSNGDVIYDGKEKQPEVKVQLHSTTLTKDVDYKVNYRDNINAGLAQIEIVGINNYSGKSFASFNIKKATPKVSALGVDSKGQVVATTNSDNHNVVYKYYTDASCTVEVTNPTKSGWYYVKTYVPETRNYSSYESTPSRVQLDSEKMMFNLQALTTNNSGNTTKSNKLVIALSSVCAALVIAILVAIPLVVKKFKSRKG